MGIPRQGWRAMWLVLPLVAIACGSSTTVEQSDGGDLNATDGSIQNPAGCPAVAPAGACALAEGTICNYPGTCGSEVRACRGGAWIDETARIPGAVEHVSSICSDRSVVPAEGSSCVVPQLNPCSGMAQEIAPCVFDCIGGVRATMNCVRVASSDLGQWHLVMTQACETDAGDDASVADAGDGGQ